MLRIYFYEIANLQGLGMLDPKSWGGRMLACDDETADAGLQGVQEMVMRNSIETFLAKMPNRVKTIEMCVDVLHQVKRGASYNNRRENEDNFTPPKTIERKLVPRLTRLLEMG